MLTSWGTQQGYNSKVEKAFEFANYREQAHTHHQPIDWLTDLSHANSRSLLHQGNSTRTAWRHTYFNTRVWLSDQQHRLRSTKSDIYFHSERVNRRGFLQRDALLFLTKKGSREGDNTAFLWLREAEKLKWVQKRVVERVRERDKEEEDKKLNSPRKKTTSNRVVCLFISFTPRTEW